MRSYKEIIKDDVFKADDEYLVQTNAYKMCWGCETKHKSGHMVYDASKMRRIFFCEDCFVKVRDNA
ncbi:MAG: hypothetical protein HWN79_08660 [Candidatus Lokiarchaeota archaeon]|nr:hypothetical protein [Candidatus Lokiarchaeota archaeon]